MPPLDPRALRPAELVRLLNSTPLGETVRPHHVYRQRNRAGYRIGEAGRIDLVRYVVWLREERERVTDRSEAAGYEAHKARMRKRSRRQAAEGQEIGIPPAVADPERRAQTTENFQCFCETYFPQTFYLPWSDDHQKVIGRIQESVREGGLFALAMPRGSGKTSLCEVGCMWAVLTGARQFVALIGVNHPAGKEMLESIKTELEVNDLLLADFPEAVYAIRALERTPNRCKTQRCGGVHTRMEWRSDVVVLPSLSAEVLEELDIPERNGCGAIIKTSGLAAKVRGMKHKRPDGSAVRPDLVILDDPQTDDIASSETQTRDRMELLCGAILGLAGPKRKICGFMPCTVIKPGDLADQVLNRDEHPEWRGERMKMLYAFPENEKLWDEYAELHRAGLAAGDTSAATEFYAERREEMDTGAVVAWEERYKEGEISALQHAMNLLIRDEQSFYAEYQNEPIPPEEALLDELEADEVAAKTNNRPRGEVPAGCELLTAAVDVHDKVLFWLVTAWTEDFTGYVVDYGTYPEQKRSHFTARKVRRTLRRIHQGVGVEGAIYAGLEKLTGQLLGREWRREDGSILRIARCFVDQGYQTDTIHEFCRQSDYAATLMPVRGAGIKAGQKPISEYRRNQGDKIGHHWWVPKSRGKRALRHVECDSNYWKTFVHDRLRTAMGDKGCLGLFGKKAVQHRLLSEHVTAEYRVRTSGHGRTVDEWKEPTHRPDNHWFDCLVYCACAASYEGVELAPLMGSPGRQEERKGVPLSELQRRKRRERKRPRR